MDAPMESRPQDFGGLVGNKYGVYKKKTCPQGLFSFLRQILKERRGPGDEVAQKVKLFCKISFKNISFVNNKLL